MRLLFPPKIAYDDNHGDRIIEYPALDYDGRRINVTYNHTGWRLLPPTCRPGCDGLVVWRIEKHGVGTASAYCCHRHFAEVLLR